MSPIHVPVRANVFRRSSFTTASITGTGTTTLFTVTGEVLLVYLAGFATAAGTVDGGTGAVTAVLGVTSSTSLFIGSTTWTDLAINTLWVSTAPNANGIALPAAMKEIAITQDILLTVSSSGTALPTAGTLRFDAYYLPLSSTGLLS